MKPVAFDLAAMFVGAASDTPRGIDRVDMGYARRFFFAPDTDAIGLLPSYSGMGALSKAEARDFAAFVQERWREKSAPDDDAALSEWMDKRLRGISQPRPARKRGRISLPHMVLRYADLVLKVRRTILRPARTTTPHGAVYVNTGQVLLRYSRFFDWFDDRPDVKAVFLVHDLIPILFPEYTGPEPTYHHERSLDLVARRAAGMIATSQTAAEEIRDALNRRGRKDIPIHVTPLPVDDAFFDVPQTRGFADAPPYFIAVGAMDQRKNHLLLLKVWRDLARVAPHSVPKLVIVGIRGRRSSGLVDLLTRSPALADSVIETNGLSTPAMRELMRGARALLMPSFTEGFGLPVVEALALKTPVIASNIAAHREVGGAYATYLDPLDGDVWVDEILRRTQESFDATEKRRDALSSYRPQTWASYFEQVLPFLDAL